MLKTILKFIGKFYLYFFGIGLVILIFVSIYDHSNVSEVEQFLTNYKFEEAREACSKITDIDEKQRQLKAITIAEAKWWCRNRNDFNRALSVVDESWSIDEKNWKEIDWQSFRYSIISDGVVHLCEVIKNIDSAKLFALKAPDNINEQGFLIGHGTGIFKSKEGEVFEYFFEGCNCEQEIAKGPSMRELLNKKIKEYEAILK
jgi:hypothetical protein